MLQTVKAVENELWMLDIGTKEEGLDYVQGMLATAHVPEGR